MTIAMLVFALYYKVTIRNIFSGDFRRDWTNLYRSASIREKRLTKDLMKSEISSLTSNLLPSKTLMNDILVKLPRWKKAIILTYIDLQGKIRDHEDPIRVIAKRLGYSLDKKNNCSSVRTTLREWRVATNSYRDNAI